MEAFLFLGAARLALSMLDFKTLASRLGKKSPSPSIAKRGENSPNAKIVGWAVALMSRYTPWESKCLVQAIAAKAMLNRRKIENTLFLGVAKDGAGKMIAHAWIKCGNLALTGSRVAEKFTVVAMFSS